MIVRRTAPAGAAADGATGAISGGVAAGPDIGGGEIVAVALVEGDSSAGTSFGLADSRRNEAQREETQRDLSFHRSPPLTRLPPAHRGRNGGIASAFAHAAEEMGRETGKAASTHANGELTFSTAQGGQKPVTNDRSPDVGDATARLTPPSRLPRDFRIRLFRSRSAATGC